MLVVDSGALFAAVNRRDPFHKACAELLGPHGEPAVVPILTLAEVSYVIAHRMGTRAEAEFATSIERGHIAIEPVESSDWSRISQLVDQYCDLPLGLVDASVVATAERLDARRVATLDHRHFSVVRPRHIDAFVLVP